MCTLHLVLVLWASEGFILAPEPLSQYCPPAELSLDSQTPLGLPSRLPKHWAQQPPAILPPPFLWNMTQFKFQINPLSLDPKGWSRTLVLLYLLKVTLHPEFNPSARLFFSTLTQHLCSELSTHRALSCSESCQYSHHVKENQESYLRQKKQISCADRINTFGVWLCQHLSFL